MIQLLDYYRKLHIQLAINFFFFIIYCYYFKYFFIIVFFSVGAYFCVFLGLFKCLAAAVSYHFFLNYFYSIVLLYYYEKLHFLHIIIHSHNQIDKNIYLHHKY